MKGEKRAIVVVPGIMGSELVCSGKFIHQKFGFKKGELMFFNPDPFKPFLDALMFNPDGSSVYPVSAKAVSAADEYFGVLGTCTQMIRGLRKDIRIRDEVFFFSYDWRLSLWELNEKLEAFISAKKIDRVSFVAHSMGGLLASRFIANNPGRVEKLISLSTPFCGTPVGLYVLETGHYFNGWKSLLNVPVAYSFKKIAKNFESVYTLLPTRRYTEYLTYIAEKSLKQRDISDPAGGFLKKHSEQPRNSKLSKLSSKEKIDNLVARRPWANQAMLDSASRFHEELMVQGRHAALTVDSYFLAGYGKGTIKQLSYSNRSGFYYFDAAFASNSGDGLVPIESATLFGDSPKDKTFYINQEHNVMLADEDVIRFVCDVLSGENPEAGNRILKKIPEQKADPLKLVGDEKLGSLGEKMVKLRNIIEMPPKNGALSLKPEVILNGGWHRSDVRVKITPLESQGVPQRVEYHINGGPVQKYEASFDLSLEGINRLVWVAYDHDDKMSQPNLLEVKIDKTPPEITVEEVPAQIENGAVLTIKFSVSDGTSGVESVKAAFNQRPFQSGDSIKAEKAGKNLIEITAHDNAGNISRRSLSILVTDEGKKKTD